MSQNANNNKKATGGTACNASTSGFSSSLSLFYQIA